MKAPILLLALLFTGTSGLCDTPPPAPGSSTNVSLSDVAVIRVRPQKLRLGDDIHLNVTNLATLVNAARTKGKPLILFLDGQELTNVQPTGIFVETNVLRFELRRTAASKDVWAPILRKPLELPVRPITLSVGIQGMPSLLVDPEARDASLIVIEWSRWVIAWAIVFLIFIVAFVILAFKSNIIKSPIPNVDGRLPYSLCRTQGAFWLFLTVMSFVFIWIVTSDLSTLNTSVLAMIGISSGTYLAAVFTEGPKIHASQDPAALVVTAAPAVAVSSAARDLRHIKGLGEFLGDVLSDDRGISVPRFQMFVWTLVLGIIFAVSVVNDLSMPEFSATLLALMGISSAAYVGDKLK